MTQRAEFESIVTAYNATGDVVYRDYIVSDDMWEHDDMIAAIWTSQAHRNIVSVHVQTC